MPNIAITSGNGAVCDNLARVWLTRWLADISELLRRPRCDVERLKEERVINSGGVNANVTTQCFEEGDELVVCELGLTREDHLVKLLEGSKNVRRVIEDNEDLVERPRELRPENVETIAK